MDENKPVKWLGSAYENWKAFPEEVQDVMGYALSLAQQGRKASNSKPLKGFKGASVLEIVDNHNGDTYRGVYTVQYGEFIYVLHAFKKKSTKGIATPKNDMNLIKQRLKDAREHYETYHT